MPGTNAQTTRAQPDDLDNLLDYDAAVDDFLKDLPINNENNRGNGLEPQNNIDEEVVLKKKRKTIPKLDEALLLSAKGIPKLRRISKERFKFRGKGHEFSDIGRLLNLYQLWMDDMYPRAKFRDAMAMVEKVGHSKRMQVMRKAWLDETQPGRSDAVVNEPVDEGDVNGGDALMSGALSREGHAPVTVEQNAAADGVEAVSRRRNDVPDDDELDELFTEQSNDQPTRSAASRMRGLSEAEGEDELDALLAEQSNPKQDARPVRKLGGPFEQESDDDLDALLAEQDSHMQTRPQQKPADRPPEDEFADEEAAMAEMGGMW